MTEYFICIDSRIGQFCCQHPHIQRQSGPWSRACWALGRCEKPRKKYKEGYCCTAVPKGPTKVYTWHFLMLLLVWVYARQTELTLRSPQVSIRLHTIQETESVPPPPVPLATRTRLQTTAVAVWSASCSVQKYSEIYSKLVYIEKNRQENAHDDDDACGLMKICENEHEDTQLVKPETPIQGAAPAVRHYLVRCAPCVRVRTSRNKGSVHVYRYLDTAATAAVCCVLLLFLRLWQIIDRVVS